MGRDAKQPTSGRSAAASRKFTRRAFLLGGAAAAAGAGGLGAYARFVEPYWVERTKVRMGLPGLAAELNGLRLLQISDLHVDNAKVEDYLADEFERCTAAAPDLIVLTGDYLTGGNPHDIAAVGRVAARLRARYGVFASLGNHDYYDYTGTLGRSVRYSGKVATDLTAVLQQAGVTVLRNQARVLRIGGGSLQLVGLEDWMVGWYDAQRAFAQVDPRLPTIALSHNPDTFPDLCQRACHWVLSGHTHGGQVRVPGIGAIRLPVQHREYDAGHFERNGRHLYVNRGIGYLLPVRFSCRPEVTEFTLSPA